MSFIQVEDVAFDVVIETNPNCPAPKAKPTAKNHTKLTCVLFHAQFGFFKGGEGEFFDKWSMQVAQAKTFNRPNVIDKTCDMGGIIDETFEDEIDLAGKVTEIINDCQWMVVTPKMRYEINKAKLLAMCGE